MKYPGKLGRRRPYCPPPSLLSDEETWNSWLKSEHAARLEVLHALLEHYDLKDQDWLGLFWKLVYDHVPEMSRRGKPGHPTKWNDLRCAELCIAVDNMVANAHSAGRRMSVNSALTHIAKQSPWKELLESSQKPADALRAQYNSASPQLVEAIRNNYQLVRDIAVVDKVLDTAIREFASTHGIKP